MLTVKEHVFQIEQRGNAYKDAIDACGFHSIVIEKYTALTRVYIRDGISFPICINDVLEAYEEDVDRLVYNYYASMHRGLEGHEDMLREISDDLFLFMVESMNFITYTLEQNNLAYSKHFYNEGDFFVKEIREVFVPQVNILSREEKLR